MEKDGEPITEILSAVGRGDAGARGRLWEVIYEELRGIARAQVARDRAGGTLQPTALIHEAYLRLMGDSDGDGGGPGGAGSGPFANRRHFFAAAARVMRCIRIDDARKRNRQKRGGGRSRVMSAEEPAVFDQDPVEVLAIEEALERLESAHPRLAEVVTLRYFAGMTRDETAEAMGLSPRTVDKDWRYARAILHQELSKGDTNG